MVKLMDVTLRDGGYKANFLIILTMISIIGLLGSDIYLPMLPEMSEFFQADKTTIQSTLSIYLLGLSVGQLVWGPLADSHGRKTILLTGLCIFSIGSLLCAISTKIEYLLFFRFIQALGACSGLVSGRAIVGDICTPQDSGKLFSTIFPFVGMSPAIAPIIGGMIGYYFSWEYTFYFMLTIGILIFSLSARYLPETLTDSASPNISKISLSSKYIEILRNKNLLAFMIAPCFAYMAYFSYLSESPFILSEMGFTAKEIGFCYISLSIGYVSGNIFSKKLLKQKSISENILIGFFFFNVGALSLLFVSLFHPTMPSFLLSISILTFGNGFLIPLGTAGAITAVNANKGLVSGLLGFLQLGSAALMSKLVGMTAAKSMVNLSISLSMITLFGLLCFLMLRGASSKSEATA